jgi:hypothetical protein
MEMEEALIDEYEDVIDEIELFKLEQNNNRL